MVESDVDEYKLNSEDRQQSLRMSLIDNEVISMVLTNKETLQKYSAQFGLPQLQEVSKAFDSCKTILDALNILKSTIEAGRIMLTEDPQQNLIEVNYNISLATGEYPPFNVNLMLEDENGNEGNDEDVQVLPPTFDYKGDKEAEERYKNTTKNTTEYVDPIIKSDVKAPNLVLEYIEPILQVHYPDGTTKSTALPPRIQGADGEKPNITEEQFEIIQEQMKKNGIKDFSPIKDYLNINRSNSVTKRSTSMYSTQSTPYPGSNNLLRENPFNNVVRPAMQTNQTQYNQSQTNQPINHVRTAFNNNITNNTNNRNNLNNNYNKANSGYSSMTMRQRPFEPNSTYGNQAQNMQNNNLSNTGYFQKSNYLTQTQNVNLSNIIEKRPRMINTNANKSNNNPRDANRSSSTPSHDLFNRFNPNKNPNIYQPNPTNNPFQINQSQFNTNNANNQRYPYDRNTQRPTMYNIGTTPNLNNMSLSNTQTVNIRQINPSQLQQQFYNKNPNIGYNNINMQQIRNDGPQNNLSKIQNQQQRLIAMQQRISQIQQQQNLLAQQNQKFKNQMDKNYAQIRLINSNNPNQQPVLRQQIQIFPQQQVSQSQQLGQNNPYNNNPPFGHQNSQEIRQVKTQMFNPGQNLPFRSQTSGPVSSQAPSLSSKNISQQLLSLAHMASMKNGENPNYNNLQSVTLPEQNQDVQSQEQDDIQEYQPQEDETQQNLEKTEDKAPAETPASQTPDGLDIEALFFTEEGKVIFRNGLLRGIIHKYAEIDEVVSKIQDLLLKGVNFHLVYKAFDLGDKARIFHEKCDKYDMTLVLIETDKDVRFGGFTTKSWQGNCVKKIDNNAFVFSLETNTIFDIIKNEPAIGCYPKFGPVFFGCQIRIYDDFFTKGGTTCHKGLNYKTKKDYELNNGEQKYLIKDIEVYSIETIDI